MYLEAAAVANRQDVRGVIMTKILRHEFRILCLLGNTIDLTGKRVKKGERSCFERNNVKKILKLCRLVSMK